MTNLDSQPGILYIAATPIGNLGDISQRLRETLARVDLVACEDTRHTRKLLSHLNINVKVTSCHRENEQQKTLNLLARLRAGENVAFVSDAGTPGLSDPGAILVRAARDAGITVIPIPGPSAVVTALSAAGLRDTSFYFGGFLPAKQSGRRKHLLTLKALPCTLIFYEAPHRIHAALHDCLEVLGNRNAQIFRELTKLHEEHLAGLLSELIERMSGTVLGELVVLISGAEEQHEEQPVNLDALIHWHRDQGSSLKDAAYQIALTLDLPKSHVYQQALRIWEQ